MVVDVFDEYGLDVEYRVPVPAQYEPPAADEPVIEIGISAVGGGTVGNAYAGQQWVFGVWSDGTLVIASDDLHSGWALCTHADMARTLCTFLSESGDHVAGGYDSVDGLTTREYGAEAAAFLGHANERFADFAYGASAYEQEEASA